LDEQRELEGKEVGEVGSEKVTEFASKTRQFVERCVSESEKIPFVKERERLLKIIDHWGSSYSRGRASLHHLLLNLP
jgi:hypothetical protein